MSELTDITDALVRGARRIVSEISDEMRASEDTEGALHAMRGRAEAAERELRVVRQQLKNEHSSRSVTEMALNSMKGDNDKWKAIAGELAAELDKYRNDCNVWHEPDELIKLRDALAVETAAHQQARQELTELQSAINAHVGYDPDDKPYSYITALEEYTKHADAITSIRISDMNEIARLTSPATFESTVDAVKRVVAERDCLLASAAEDAKTNDSHREQWQNAVRAKNAAYAERNQCVALIAKMAIALRWTPTGVGDHVDVSGNDPLWEPDWRTLLFVQLPTGQATWHFHDSEKHLLEGLPQIPTLKWDGHSTEEKYERVNAVAPKWNDERGSYLERLQRLGDELAQVLNPRGHESVVDAAKRCVADMELAETEVGDLRVVIRSLEDRIAYLSKESSAHRAEHQEARNQLNDVASRLGASDREHGELAGVVIETIDGLVKAKGIVTWEELRDVLVNTNGYCSQIVYERVRVRAERV